MDNKEKNRQRALKAWETMRNRGYIKNTSSIKKCITYNNLAKKKQREILIELIKKHLDKFKKSNPLRNTDYMPHGIYLESPELLFTKLIDEARLNHEVYFTIPNNLEYEKFYKSRDIFLGGTTIQFKEHQCGCYYEPIQNIGLVNCSYNDHVKYLCQDWHSQKIERWSHFFIWADYCGTFSTFSEDIELTFSKNILGINSIYAMTFAVRDMARKNKLPQYSETNCMVAVNDFVSKVASKYGYTAELLPESGCYKSTMYTAIFLIKNKYLEKSVIELQSMIETLERKKWDIEYEINHLKNQASQVVLNLNKPEEQIKISSGLSGYLTDAGAKAINEKNGLTKKS